MLFGESLGTALIVQDCILAVSLVFWRDLQDLTLLDGMCIPFQYFTECDVSLRLELQGC